MSEKLFKDIVQITIPSIKGRHSIDAEINIKSFEHGYFLWIEMVFGT